MCTGIITILRNVAKIHNANFKVVGATMVVYSRHRANKVLLMAMLEVTVLQFIERVPIIEKCHALSSFSERPLE